MACLVTAPKASAQNLNDPAQLAAVAAALYGQGKVREALTLAQAGLVQHPENMRLLGIAGATARTLALHAEAKSYWEKAKTLEPANIYVTENLVLTYQIEGDKERRDGMRAELLKLRSAAADPKTLRPSYARDEFRVGPYLVVCREYYALEGPQAMRYDCPVYKDITTPAVFRVILGSYDQANQKAREMGALKPGERFFHLIRQDGKTVDNYVNYLQEPSYDVIREQVVLIIEGNKKPVSPSTAAASPSAVLPVSEELIAAFLTIRETLIREGKVDISEMSKAIRSVVSEVIRLAREANHEGALKQLRELESYCPLVELPSFEVQLLASSLYSRLGDRSSAVSHKARADAMHEILWRRIGSGETPDDPKRAMMINDVTEWTRSQQAQVVGTKGYPHKGRELLEITYSGPATGNQPKLAYFEIDPRVRTASNRRMRLYDPLPLAKMGPEERRLIDQATENRNRFLDDTTMPYAALMGKVREAMKEAMHLESQKKSAEALAKLKEIEQIRFIEEIPITDLLSLYSLLNGRVGNTQKQMELRALLFGINQSIAHAGDGLSAETAVEVIAVSEEYAWLRDKGLKASGQRIYNTSTGKFDVLKATDANGNEHDYYFNITRMYPKNLQGLGLPTARQ